MASELLYATNNPGKIGEISKHLIYNGIQVLSPKDLGIDLDVPETGNSLEENSKLKALGFLALPEVGNRLVLADDTGLEIDALDGKPNIHVRRWKDGQTRMSDEEIIQFCLEQMKDIPLENRGAQFRTVLTLAKPGGEIEFYDGVLRGVILEQPGSQRVEGFPFESLFYVPEWGKLLYEARQLSAKEKSGMLNHRERAIEKAIPRIRELLIV